MNRKPDCSKDPSELRRNAEERLRARMANQEGATSEVDTQRLLHELQVHQIELEMQNEELADGRNELEMLLEKYTDLYDFAPVGYFSLDAKGRIQEVNLTGATLLGVNRGELIDQNLAGFTTMECRPAFGSFLERVFSGSEEQCCEAILVKTDGTAFWAAFHGSSAFYTGARHDWCRVAVSDITAQREAEEAQRQSNLMSIANQALQREVAQRKVVEEHLRKSQKETILLLEQSQHLQEQLRSLSRRILTVQEEERKRISRELHDEITQTLVSINVHLASLSRDAEANPKGLRKCIEKTQKQVGQSVDIAHRFARELRPPVLDDLGLIPVLEDVLKIFMRDTGIRVSLKAFSGVEKLDIDKRTTLYRVVQEALANIDRHAHASRVEVNIKQLATAAHMYIKDNGCSFKADKVLHSRKKMPLGLLGMRERAEMVGGTLSIESTPAHGTTIHVLIPLADTERKQDHEP